MTARRRLAPAALAAAALAVAAGRAALAPPSAPAARPAAAALAATLGRQPLLFVANVGQADAAADFVAEGHGTSALFGAGGVGLRLVRPGTAASACGGRRGDGVCRAALAAPSPRPLASLAAGARAGDAARGTVDALELRFVDAAGARPRPANRAPTTISHFRGPRSAWRIAEPTYRRLVYDAVWPGIDVAFDGAPGQLKQTFTVAPGADPGRIRLAWRGATSLAVDAAGALVVGTAAGAIVDEAPRAWQTIRGRRVAVAVAFALDGPVGGGHGYHFAVGDYDPAHALVIDPAVVAFAGFIGAGGVDRGLGLALGPDGAVWVAGQSGPAAYVAKLDAEGTAVEQVGLFHAADTIAAFDIAVDGDGYGYVTGIVMGDGGDDFPVSFGPDTTYNGGLSDAFVAKMTPDAKSLVYCGYLGGAAIDFGEGVAVDAAGHAYLSGLAQSSEATFPAVVGPDLTHNGDFDAYIVKLKPDPTAPDVRDNVVYAGFMGGDGLDVTVTDDGWLSSGHVAVGSDGAAYLSGQTTSREDTFPDGDGLGELPTFDGTYNGGSWDAYVVKVRPDGTGFAYAGFLGGSHYDDGKGMAIGADGTAYVTGDTASDDFPVRGGPDLTANGKLDATVAAVAPDGRSLVFAGYFGGDDDEQGQAVALGPDGALYVTGRTESTGDTFPAVGGPDLTHNGPDGLDDAADEGDAFIGRLAARQGGDDPRANWDYLGYIGGDAGDGAYWLAIDARHRAYLVGDTDSNQATFPDGDGMGGVPTFDGTFEGQTDAFVARVDYAPPPPRIALPWLGRSADRDAAPTAAVVTPAPTATPPPTSTRRPLPTALPTARPTAAVTVPEGEELVFFDDFGDPASGWDSLAEDGDVWRYVDGAFEVATDAPGRLTGPFAPRRVRFGDGVLRATARLDQGDDASYGLLFNGGSLFLFVLGGDGTWGVFKVAGGSLAPVLALSPSPAVPTERGAVVRLRIERLGRRAAFFVDDVRLGEIDDPDLVEPGQPGLFISAGDDVPARARYDDLLVTRWTDPAPVWTPAPTATAGAGLGARFAAARWAVRDARSAEARGVRIDRR